MPNMANIVVKDLDGSTDVTFEKLVPSAGDKSPAIWRLPAASGIPSAAVTLSVTSKASVNRKVRIVEGVVICPIIETDPHGAVKVVDRDTFTFSGQVKVDYAQPLHDRNVALATGLIRSDLIREILRVGYSAT